MSRSRGTRPKIPYRLPLTQERRRQDIVTSSEAIKRHHTKALKHLSDALIKIGMKVPEATTPIATVTGLLVEAQELLDTILAKADAMQYGPEPPGND